MIDDAIAAPAPTDIPAGTGSLDGLPDVPIDPVEGGIELLLPILGEISEGVTELQEEPRPFLTTPIEEYSVTEGMLLLLVVLLLVGFLYNVIKEAF